MSTIPALGKCSCGEQLLEIPPRAPGFARRTICPVCVANALEDVQREHRYKPTAEEVERMENDGG